MLRTDLRLKPGGMRVKWEDERMRSVGNCKVGKLEAGSEI